MSGLVPNTYAPPEWLTQDFLQSALRVGIRRGSLNVRTCSFTPATNVGDNYLSQMFRASARVTNRKGSQDMSVVIKSMPKGQVIENFVNEQQFFVRETRMLSETLPQLQEVLDEVGGQRLFAQLYFKADGPDTSLVLEDLCESGFRSVNRLALLDMNHSVLVMEYLAIFHAASLRAIERHPEIKTIYKNTFWQRSNETTMKKFFDQDTQNILLCLKTWKNFPPEMVAKVERFRDSGLEKIFQCSDLREAELNVLNHADPWTSNIMFKYENDLPTDLRFVDFQLSFYNSPAFDILYFMFTSPQIDIRVSRIDDLLAKYHSKLVEMCVKLKYPLDLSLDGLRKMVFDRIAYAFFATVVLLPFMMTESSQVTDINEYLEKQEEDRGVFLIQNKKYKEIVELMLPFLDRNGVFD